MIKKSLYKVCEMCIKSKNKNDVQAMMIETFDRIAEVVISTKELSDFRDLIEFAFDNLNGVSILRRSNQECTCFFERLKEFNDSLKSYRDTQEVTDTTINELRNWIRVFDEFIEEADPVRMFRSCDFTLGIYLTILRNWEFCGRMPQTYHLLASIAAFQIWSDDSSTRAELIELISSIVNKEGELKNGKK